MANSANFQLYIPLQLDVVLESVIEVDKKSASDRGCTITSLIDSLNAKKTMSETMIFGIDSIVSVDLLDVDLDYAFKDGFKTDAEISGLKNAKAEKQLVEWVDDAPMPKRGTRDVSLEPSNGQTGWSAQDMFKYNEEVNGVVVGYKGLDNVYTTAINRDDPGYLEKERKAELLARQIIDGGRPCPEDEDECRDGRDEEQRWSEVYRKDVSYRSKEPSTRTTVPHPSKKPSDGNWRDTNPRVGSGEKSKQNLGKPQQDSPRQQFSVKNQNQHSPKPMADTHNYHTELSKKSPVLRTSSKEHVESGRPISFAAAVGLSEVKPGMPTLTQVRSHAVEAQKPEPVDVPEQNIIHDQEKSGLIDSPKVDQGVQKKSDVTSSEVEAVAKTSKLNPNAKEFTLNPTAKPFTPKNHFSPPPQPLIAHHPSVSQPNMGPASYQHNAQQQQQLQPHQQPKHHQQASQYLVMNTPGSNLVMPHQQVIGPNGQPFQLLNPVVVNQLPGNHNSNQYNPGYNQGNSQPSRKSHHGSREPRQGPGHSRHDNNSYNPHNVAAATGHPVLAGAPLTASGPLQFNHHHHQGGPPGPGQQTGPGGQPMFSPMFVQGYPRMFQPQMIGPYDHQYFSKFFRLENYTNSRIHFDLTPQCLYRWLSNLNSSNNSSRIMALTRHLLPLNPKLLQLLDFMARRLLVLVAMRSFLKPLLLNNQELCILDKQCMVLLEVRLIPQW